jgi:hypothetical protein
MMTNVLSLVTVSRKSVSLPATDWLLLPLCLSFLLSACQSLPTKTYEIRQRAFTYSPASLLQDYQEEYAYIQNRREAVANGTGTSDTSPVPPVSQIPPHLKGLAFSGGGIRSATFHLGLLQALHDMKTLPKIDYLSTVSLAGCWPIWERSWMTPTATSFKRRTRARSWIPITTS